MFPPRITQDSDREKGAAKSGERKTDLLGSFFSLHHEHLCTKRPPAAPNSSRRTDSITFFPFGACPPAPPPPTLAPFSLTSHDDDDGGGAPGGFGIVKRDSTAQKFTHICTGRGVENIWRFPRSGQSFRPLLFLSSQFLQHEREKRGEENKLPSSRPDQIDMHDSPEASIEAMWRGGVTINISSASRLSSFFGMVH